jgi:outer membrane protein assembly factor BamE (lipoprotein component of BamABCDE complex)
MTTSNKKRRKPKKSPELKIARFILLVLGAMAMLAYFSACKTKQPVVTDSEIISEKGIEKDKLTPVSIPGETTKLKALFECDSLNRVLLINYNELKSKNINSNFSFANGQLDYTAKTEPDTVFIKSTDRWYYINRHIKRTVTITQKVPVEVNKWGFLDWVGLLTLIAGAVLLAINLLTKPFLKYINSFNK